MRRKFVIDGYNLLHQIAEIAESREEDLESRRERLLRKLVGLTARQSFELLVVFDGSSLKKGKNHYAGLEVVFASPTADHFIRQIIAQNQRNRELVIVTSDRKDIGEYAQVSGVEWMTSQRFWDWFRGAASRRSKASDEKEAKNSRPPGWTAQDDADLRKAFEE